LARLRELAVRITDQHGYFVAEASVYRLLKAQDLIASPAFIVMKPDEFKDRSSAPTRLWQTDFTYLKERSPLTRHRCVFMGLSTGSGPGHHAEARELNRSAALFGIQDWDRFNHHDEIDILADLVDRV
jgi:hypothetical protein